MVKDVSYMKIKQYGICIIANERTICQGPKYKDVNIYVAVNVKYISNDEESPKIKEKMDA